MFFNLAPRPLGAASHKSDASPSLIVVTVESILEPTATAGRVCLSAAAAAAALFGRRAIVRLALSIARAGRLLLRPAGRHTRAHLTHAADTGALSGPEGGGSQESRAAQVERPAVGAGRQVALPLAGARWQARCGRLAHNARGAETMAPSLAAGRAAQNQAPDWSRARRLAKRRAMHHLNSCALPPPFKLPLAWPAAQLSRPVESQLARVLPSRTRRRAGKNQRSDAR